MSRNLGTTSCEFCYGDVALDEIPRPITRAEAGCYYETHEGYGYARGIFANATCKTCGAKYLAWVDLRACDGYGGRSGSNWGDGSQPFFDLSHRSTFNDEPGEEDLPDWRIETVELSPEICRQLEAVSGEIKKCWPWQRCDKTARKVYYGYGCPCDEHRR